MSGVRGIKLEQALNQDVKVCWEVEPIAMASLCPVIYEWYPEESLESTDLLRLVVSTIDSNQLQDIVWSITQGNFIMMDIRDLLSIISKTKKYNTRKLRVITNFKI